MNRFAFAVFIAATLVVVLPAHRTPVQGQEAPGLHSKELDVTGIANGKAHVTEDKIITTFSFVGAPTIHAVLPQKRMTIDAATLSGHLLHATGVLKDAVMTGGVHGTLESDAKQGVNISMFDGASVTYKDRGSAGSQGADIDATGSVKFQSSNNTVGSKFNLTGTHGTFQLRTPKGGGLTLLAADLDGPATYTFSGVRVGADKRAEPSKGSGTAGHLHLTRGGDDGTDYVLHLSGGVSIKGNFGGFDGDFPKTESVTVVMDEGGNFKSLSTDDTDTAGTLTPEKKRE